MHKIYDLQNKMIIKMFNFDWVKYVFGPYKIGSL